MKIFAGILGFCIALPGFAQNVINPFEDNGSAIAYYQFNEGEGTTISDVSGNGNDGVMSDGQWVVGAHQKGIQLTAPDGKVNLGDFSIENEFTIECWVYPTSLEGENYIIQKMYGDSSDNYRLAIIDGRVIGGIDIWYNDSGYFNSGERKIVSADIPAANQWYYIAITWDGGKDGSALKLFVNGEQKDRKSAQFFPVKQNESDAYIGWAESAGSFKGIIDELRISDKTTIAARIELNYEDALMVSGIRRQVKLETVSPATSGYKIYTIRGIDLTRSNQSRYSTAPCIVVNREKAAMRLRMNSK
jgi:hypothetical protein